MKLLVRAIVFVWGLLMLTEAGGQVLENYNPHIQLNRKNEFTVTPVKASVSINTVDFPQSSFEMSFPKEAAVFLGDKLWFYTKKDTSFTVPILSVREFAGDQLGEVDLVVYKEGMNGDGISIKKGVFVYGHEVQGKKENEAVLLRKQDRVKDFLIVAFVIILALIALFKVTYPVMFQSALRPASVFTEDFTDPGSGGSVYSSDMVFNLLGFSMLLSLFVMSAVYFWEVPILGDYLAGKMDFLFMVWLSGTVIVMVLSYIKYFWIKTFTTVYQIERWDFSQFFYLMRGLFILMLLFFTVIFGFYLQSYPDMDMVMNYAVSTFLIIYLLGIIRLFYIMLRKVPFKSYHLFSYICSSELIPFLVIAKIIWS
ncbi:hypothetical protein GCM10028791_00650 [Echinicola sediminis]